MNLKPFLQELNTHMMEQKEIPNEPNNSQNILAFK
jgi:hypothetical protein